RLLRARAGRLGAHDRGHRRHAGRGRSRRRAPRRRQDDREGRSSGQGRRREGHRQGAAERTRGGLRARLVDDRRGRLQAHHRRDAVAQNPGSTTILVVLALTTLVAYAARNALFAVSPDLQRMFHIDHADIGLLTTLFMVPHALATLGFGWAGDRYDRRTVI